ncbi:MAG TPA: HAD hydrolase-like protein [Rickettsiales bacterium]|nr:HAD hydrolase-like protein [Rickettsiales bacterium]
MIKLILSDFDGVLSNVDRDFITTGFYTTIRNENPELMQNIQNFLFHASGHITRAWMQGDISYKELNMLMARKFNTTEDYLNNHLIESVKKMKLNENLINFYQKQKNNGTKVYIMSDNMDIFSEVSVKHFNLNKYFDKIYNSSDVKQLKRDKNCELARRLASETGCENRDVLVIDDGKKLLDELNEYGFKTYLYNNETYNQFEDWFVDNCN